MTRNSGHVIQRYLTSLVTSKTVTPNSCMCSVARDDLPKVLCVLGVKPTCHLHLVGTSTRLSQLLHIECYFQPWIVDQMFNSPPQPQPACIIKRFGLYLYWILFWNSGITLTQITIKICERNLASFNLGPCEHSTFFICVHISFRSRKMGKSLHKIQSRWTFKTPTCSKNAYPATPMMASDVG